MGLEGVEIILTVEETFGVEITDADWAKLTTPGTLVDCVAAKLRLMPAPVCQSQRAFYLLRRAFMREFGLRRAAVTLDTPLRPLFREDDIAAVWARLKEHVAARHWPRLVRPWWLQLLLWMTFPAAFAVGFVGLPLLVALWCGALVWVLWIATLPLALAGHVLLFRKTRPLATRLPRRFRRLRDLVRYAESSEQVEWDRPAIARLVKAVVIEQLGIAESKYREDAHFVKDLGMG